MDLPEKDYYNHFDFGTIIPPTLKHNNKTCRSRKWFWSDPEVIQIELGNCLYDWIKKLGNQLAGSKTLFFIDDIMADKTLDKHRHTPLLDLAMSGKHKVHLLWLLTQAYSAVPKNIRREAKMLYVSYAKNRAGLNTVHEENNVIGHASEC